MQPRDFIEFNILKWAHTRDHIDTGNRTPDVNDNSWFLICVSCVDFITTDGHRTEVVDLHGQFLNMDISIVMQRKITISRTIGWAAREYWRRYCRREYQHVIAQILQRETSLPGEVATAIASFA